MTDRNYNPTAYIFRDIREQIDGQTVRVLLEPWQEAAEVARGRS